MKGIASIIRVGYVTVTCNRLSRFLNSYVEGGILRILYVCVSVWGE